MRVITTRRRRGGIDKTTRRDDFDITTDPKKHGLEDAGGEDDEVDDIIMTVNARACHSTTLAYSDSSRPKGHFWGFECPQAAL